MRPALRLTVLAFCILAMACSGDDPAPETTGESGRAGFAAPETITGRWLHGGPDLFNTLTG